MASRTPAVLRCLGRCEANAPLLSPRHAPYIARRGIRAAPPGHPAAAAAAAAAAATAGTRDDASMGALSRSSAAVIATSAAAAAAAAAVAYWWSGHDVRAQPAEQASKPDYAPGATTEDPRPKPWFRRAEVAEHDKADRRIWVTYKDGVYDITDFIVNHPGGAKILLAAGKAIDPFWRIYQQHMNTGLPSQLLAGMRIGSLDPNEPVDEVDETDPYANDPERHPALTFHSKKPANAELPPDLILDNWITPSALFFIRHHHPVPAIKPKEFTVDFGGLGVKPILLTLDDLRRRFPKNEVTTTIQCGGNRRNEFNRINKTSGISWGFGAMSNATFGGVYLRDVLMYSGLLRPDTAANMGVKHVCFKGVDGVQASIPIEKALSPFGDVLIAYEMNGKPLPPEHGGPLRMVVPGHVGIRNIKWVNEIKTSDEEAHGPWQRGIAYKGFSPNVKSFEGLDIEKIQSVQEQPVTSAIVEPQPGEEVEPGQDMTVRGLAWSGGGRGIVRVDVSIDGGTNWTTATLTNGKDQGPLRSWAWTFWEADVAVPEDVPQGKPLVVMCKATDVSYNNQPEYAESIWNIRGLNNNSWHRVPVVVAVDDDEADEE